MFALIISLVLVIGGNLNHRVAMTWFHKMNRYLGQSSLSSFDPFMELSTILLLVIY